MFCKDGKLYPEKQTYFVEINDYNRRFEQIWGKLPIMISIIAKAPGFLGKSGAEFLEVLGEGRIVAGGFV